MADPGTNVISAAIRTTIDRVSTDLVEAIPLLISGLIFLAVASLTIRFVLRIARVVLRRLYGPETLVPDLLVTVVGLFLWFGTALTLLQIVGMEGIAASLGTAAGFVALGVSYALSDVIADVVAGVYLLRDPDFNVGDRVTAAETTGEVVAIELRKSRIRADDGDLVVLPNRDVETGWTRESGRGTANDGEATS